MQYSSIGRSILSASKIGIGINDSKEFDEKDLKILSEQKINLVEFTPEILEKNYFRNGFREKLPYIFTCISSYSKERNETLLNIINSYKISTPLNLVLLKVDEYNSDDMQKLIELQSGGIITNIGLVDPSIGILREYDFIDAIILNYSILERDAEEEGILDFCYDHCINVIAKSQKLSQSYAGMERSNEYSIEEILLINELKPISGKYGISIPELSCLWALKRPGITHLMNTFDDFRISNLNSDLTTIELQFDDIRTINRTYNKYISMEMAFN